MLKELFSTKELAEILEIDMISAEELLNGTIDFEESEIYCMAAHKGISIDEIVHIIVGQ